MLAWRLETQSLALTASIFQENNYEAMYSRKSVLEIVVVTFVLKSENSEGSQTCHTAV